MEGEGRDEEREEGMRRGRERRNEEGEGRDEEGMRGREGSEEGEGRGGKR